ncbi:XopAD/skwp family type III secretion system effector [Brenneria rubrifaciens]|nr:XopAD/skwp family type III secretion system effector [Brenneria rubrifaciens]
MAPSSSNTQERGESSHSQPQRNNTNWRSGRFRGTTRTNQPNTRQESHSRRSSTFSYSGRSVRQHLDSDALPESRVDHRKALNFPEQHLSRQERSELQQQRLQQRNILLKNYPVQHAAQQCIDMAFNNIVAKRNGVGCALIFVQADDRQDINFRLLGNYLQKLSTNTPHNSPLLMSKTRQCASLAANYLMHTGLFSNAHPNNYAHLANKLAKHTQSQECIDALDWVARQILRSDQEQFQDLKDHEICIMTFGFLRNPQSEACRDATLRAAHELMRRQAPSLQQHARNTSAMLSALSRWPEHDDVKGMALQLAERIILDNRMVQAMDKLAISTCANALCKWPGREEAKEAVLTLTKGIKKHTVSLSDVDEQWVANILNALSKWPESERARKTVQSLAVCVLQNAPLRQSMRTQAIDNSLNALSKWPEFSEMKNAALKLAERIIDEKPVRQDMLCKELIGSMNALSKWADTSQARAASLLMAERLIHQPHLRQMMDTRHVSTLLNALSKWPDSTRAEELTQLVAERIVTDVAFCQMMKSQSVANALNALSKWPASSVINDAVVQLAIHIRNDRQISQSMTTQEMANSLNALSRWNDLPPPFEAALVLTERITTDRTLRQKMEGQFIANILSALSKWPHDERIKEAALLLGDLITQKSELWQTLPALNAANVMNAMSKWPQNPRAQAAARPIIERFIADKPLRQSLNPVGIASVINALGTLSKWDNTPQIKEAALLLADRLSTDVSLQQSLTQTKLIVNTLVGLSKFAEDKRSEPSALLLATHIINDEPLRQSIPENMVANALNALSKWLDLSHIRKAFLLLVERIVMEEELVPAMDFKAISSVLNAIGKWSDNDLVDKAALRLAEYFTEDETQSRNYTPQEFANIFNDLGKWQKEPLVQQIMWDLATLPGKDNYAWKNFNLMDLTQISIALMRMVGSTQSSTEDELAHIKPVLHDMAIHLELHPQLLSTAEAWQIGVIFKSLGGVQLQRTMRPLAAIALTRIEALCQRDQLRDQHLEAIGNLCLSLQPLLRNQELTRFRQSALQTFLRLQPIIDRKLQGFLRSQKTEPSIVLRYKDRGEACDTRCPALTFYQLLKSYNMVSRQWRPSNIDGDYQTIKERQAELKLWVKTLLERTRAIVEADLQESSWNVIAQIEADDDVLSALDLRMRKELEPITQRHPPSQFDLASSFAGMRTEPGKIRAVPPNVGDTVHKIVDVNGQLVKDTKPDNDTEKSYSLYARLTGLPLVEVKLPGRLSAFMLARTFNYEGEPWRFDMFGGSRLTRGRMKQVKNILAGKDPDASLLPAIRYSDSAPGSPLMTLIKKLAPQREDWSRMQRSLLEMIPHDHVAEGTLRTGWFADVPGAEHPFRPLGPNRQRLALCPNDGCGFLKMEVAMRIPVIRDRIENWSPDNQQVSNSCFIPPQALQHFPRNDAALAEAREVMQHRIQTLARQKYGHLAREGQIAADDVDLLQLYQLTVSGGYDGKRIRAVPSADDKLHLPPSTSAEFERCGGDLLLGKPPYDKENLLPLPPERVATVKQGDATAQFLAECFSIQYSYTGFDDLSGQDHDMLHSKGMLIIVPDKSWPPEFQNMDLACSKEDMKTLSRWVDGRDRAAIPQQIVSTGSLRVKDILVPGQLGAIPISELRKRNMDTDGDDAFIYAGYPKLSAAIRQTMQERDATRGTVHSFKPPKTAHSAFDDEGHYQAGRGKEILAEQKGGKLMGMASNTATFFFSQPDELRKKLAYNMMFGTYDGIDRQLRNGLNALLGNRENAPSLQTLQEIAQQDIERAHLPEARQALELLSQLIQQLAGQKTEPPSQIPAELAEHFPQLDQAYSQAENTPMRIEAILNNYPICRLAHSEFPNGQPGLIEGHPELTMRNLFTIAVKVGTDALKSDTGTELFTHIMEKCEASLHSTPERIHHVPHTKQTARAIRDGHFDPEQARNTLSQIPTMAAGVMEIAVETLQQAGVLSPLPTPVTQMTAIRPQDILQNARTLNLQAVKAEPAITSMLQNLLKNSPGEQARLAGLEHAVKSVGSLSDKLRYLMAYKSVSLQEAVAKVSDALRYSIVLPHDTFTRGCRHILAALDDAGHRLSQRINHFNQQGYAFRAISTKLNSPDGIVWEIQFHTPQTFELKEKFHDLYKKAQAVRYQSSNSDQERETLRPAREAFRAVPLPPGCDELDNWEAMKEPEQTPSPAKPPRSSGKNPVIPPHLAVPVRQVVSTAQALEKRVTPVLLPILAQFDAKLYGDQNWQSHIFKNEKSIARKIDLVQQKEQISPEAAAQQIRDGLRYVVILPYEQFYQAAQGIVNTLKQSAITVMRINNAFTIQDTTYVGLNINLHRSGTLQGDFEIQFHTSSSLHNKLKTHRYYEKLRQLPDIPPGVPLDEITTEFAAKREQLEQKMRDAASLVKRPERIENIPSFNRYIAQQ